MNADAGGSPVVAVTGELRWNEFEGGFWSLELDAGKHGLGSSVVLVDPSIPERATDRTRVRALVRPLPETIGFEMAGTRVEVVELHAMLPPPPTR